MSDIVSRLKELIKITCSGNAREFSRKTEIPYGTLQGYLRGRLPHSEHLIRMSESVGTNINWLLTDKGKMFGDNSGVPDMSQADLNIDLDVLHQIIEWLEERLESEGKELAPDKKARFIALTYEYFVTPEEGKEVDDKGMKQLFRLVV